MSATSFATDARDSRAVAGPVCSGWWVWTPTERGIGVPDGLWASHDQHIRRVEQEDQLRARESSQHRHPNAHAQLPAPLATGWSRDEDILRRRPVLQQGPPKKGGLLSERPPQHGVEGRVDEEDLDQARLEAASERVGGGDSCVQRVHGPF